MASPAFLSAVPPVRRGHLYCHAFSGAGKVLGGGRMDAPARSSPDAEDEREVEHPLHAPVEEPLLAGHHPREQRR